MKAFNSPLIQSFENVNDLLLQLYRLSQDCDIEIFQNSALNLVKQRLPFDAAVWGTARTEACGIDIHTIHLHQKSPDMVSDYAAVKHLDTSAASVFGKSRITCGFHAETFFASSEQLPLKAFLKQHAQQNFFITAQNSAATQLLHWVSLFRGDPNAGCLPTEIELLDQLAPHLMQALSMNQKLHMTKVHGQAKAEPKERACAIADLRGVIYTADACFCTLLNNEWAGWHGPQLPTQLTSNFLGGNLRFTGHSITVSLRLEHSLLFLKARAIYKADRLSPREFSVARLAAKGYSYKKIAQTLGSSPHTVRNQIRAIYNKLQVDTVTGVTEELRQADLI